MPRLQRRQAFSRGSIHGYVVRVADSFSYGAYRNHVAKFVRKGHVQTNKHWMHGQRIVRNQLAT
jgi:hypothetical protein